MSASGPSGPLVLLMEYLCLFLSHGLTKEYIISVFIFSVGSIFASRLITKYLSYSFWS